MRKKMLEDESGQVLVLVVLCMTILVGFMALAIDVGLLFRAKRNLQIAADAAATAAALDYFYDNSIDNAKAVGIQAATENGVTASPGGPTVTFNTGTDITTSYHQGAGYFEAVLTQPNPVFFMSILGISNLTVTARAVAGTPGKALGCVYVMDPTGTLGKNGDTSMYLQGSFTVNANKCGVMINGTADDAVYFNGGGGTLTAASVAIVGGDGGQTGDSTPAPVKGVAPVTNPLQAITPPTPSGCISGGSLTGTVGTAGGTVCYSGDSNGNITVSNATLNGTVIFSGTGKVTFGGNIGSGSGGSTIDINSGGMTENSGTVFALSAPTTGTYTGVVLMAPLSNTSTFMFDFGHSSGTLTGTVNGIIDIPGADLALHDSGGDDSGGLTLNVDLIVGEIDDQTATLTINSFSASNSDSPLKAVSLVE
jgi:Flp pilus assembly protein TadG